MEQAVWLAFGVIAIVLGLAIVANLITSNKDEQKLISFRQAMDRIKDECDFVCASPTDTYQAVDVELPSGMRIYSSDTRICGHLSISYENTNETKCVMCKCPVVMVSEINLQTELALKSFSTHSYTCYFERRENEIGMECKG